MEDLPLDELEAVSEAVEEEKHDLAKLRKEKTKILSDIEGARKDLGEYSSGELKTLYKKIKQRENQYQGLAAKLKRKEVALRSDQGAIKKDKAKLVQDNRDIIKRQSELDKGLVRYKNSATSADKKQAEVNDKIKQAGLVLERAESTLKTANEQADRRERFSANLVIKAEQYDKDTRARIRQEKASLVINYARLARQVTDLEKYKKVISSVGNREAELVEGNKTLGKGRKKISVEQNKLADQTKSLSDRANSIEHDRNKFNDEKDKLKKMKVEHAQEWLQHLADNKSIKEQIEEDKAESDGVIHESFETLEGQQEKLQKENDQLDKSQKVLLKDRFAIEKSKQEVNRQQNQAAKDRKEVSVALADVKNKENDADEALKHAINAKKNSLRSNKKAANELVKSQISHAAARRVLEKSEKHAAKTRSRLIQWDSGLKARELSLKEAQEKIEGSWQHLRSREAALKAAVREMHLSGRI